MTTRANRTRIGNALLTDVSDDHDKNISEDDDSNSDVDESTSETESDDTSTDECISQESGSDNSVSSSDEEDIQATHQPEFVEKGGIVWSMQSTKVHGRLPATSVLKKKPGAVTPIQTVMDAFKLFITDQMLNEIVLQTNKYAKRHFDERNKMRSTNNPYYMGRIQWKALDRIELEAFIGLLVQAGVRHANHESTTELWDITNNVPIYNATMPLRRFKDLLRFLRFDDRQYRNKSDCLSPIRFVFESFVKQLPRHYTPSEYLTVDEQLVPFRGRCSFIQYMPKKNVKYGLKFWSLCDAETRYVLTSDLYTGRKGNTVEHNLSTNVVLRLVDHLPSNVKQGRHVTYDRYFTSLILSEALLERGMTSLGVVNHKRSFVPNEMKLVRNELYSSWFYFSGPNTILSYQAKKKKPPVILLSTLHQYSEEFDDEKKLPVMIHDYNQMKGGVDVVNQCINKYTVRRITRRWPMMVFFNMIDIAGINAMAIWLCQNPTWNKKHTHVRRLFLSELSKNLTTVHNERRSQQLHLSTESKLALQCLGYEVHSDHLPSSSENSNNVNAKKRCYLCPSHPGRKVRQVCNTCQNHVCNSHATTTRTTICTSCETDVSMD